MLGQEIAHRAQALPIAIVMQYHIILHPTCSQACMHWMIHLEFMNFVGQAASSAGLITPSSDVLMPTWQWASAANHSCHGQWNIIDSGPKPGQAGRLTVTAVLNGRPDPGRVLQRAALWQWDRALLSLKRQSDETKTPRDLERR